MFILYIEFYSLAPDPFQGGTPWCPVETMLFRFHKVRLVLSTNFVGKTELQKVQLDTHRFSHIITMELDGFEKETPLLWTNLAVEMSQMIRMSRFTSSVWVTGFRILVNLTPSSLLNPLNWFSIRFASNCSSHYPNLLIFCCVWMWSISLPLYYGCFNAKLLLVSQNESWNK